MTVADPQDWRHQFGLEDRGSPSFFSSEAELVQGVPQAHILRRAFTLLDLAGVLCAENTPLVYFKEVDDFAQVDVAKVYHQFWNHGGAPILVLISPDQIHVYSGLCKPVGESRRAEGESGLVEQITRVATALREFLISVESGAYFHRKSLSFNPKLRVDRHLLDDLKRTREQLSKVSQGHLPPRDLDALLCRLVFTCYLFDRDVIGAGYLLSRGLPEVSHLRGILAIEPREEAIRSLYRLFESLGKDFNGDLFSDDLRAEAESITPEHLEQLDGFFNAKDPVTGQQSFWPYDFGVIPIETISAIYEQFLEAGHQKEGAFYTPRFLAEAVLDGALDGMPSLLGKRFLDPACGSGIFLVGLFNRMAEEWKRANPNAPHDQRAGELMRILRDSLFGVDISKTACRITAFSLYVAYLDQLSPRDIQGLQLKGRALPRLIANSGQAGVGESEGNIRCADFFAESEAFPRDVELVVGNPPWGKKAGKNTPAGKWCKAHRKPIAHNQIAAAFVWKAAEHVSDEGRVCLVLPYGLLFQHKSTAIAFQKAWLQQNAIERVLNLADFRWFLFGKAVHPALVVNYRKSPPEGARHRIDYWVPKADWAATQAEMITIGPGDRTSISLGEILQDLDGPDAPQVWKQRFWASPRDLRLIDRLSLYPRLRDHVGQETGESSEKPWRLAAGLRFPGKSDPERRRAQYKLPTQKFVPTESASLDLFILESDCDDLPSHTIVSRGIPRNPSIFKAPHVLFNKGFTRAAYADFDVAFLEAVRGIHGPSGDRAMLIFLAAYLRTSLAEYFLLHTSSSLGVGRPELHVEEVLRLPMPFPDDLPDPKRAREIVAEVAGIVTAATRQAEGEFVDRKAIISEATEAVEPLIEEYFDLITLEKHLIDDTINVVIPSIQPTRKRMPVETVKPSTGAQRTKYRDRVSEMLNGWARRGSFAVRGEAYGDDNLGLGWAVFEKVERSAASSPMPDADPDLLSALDRLRKMIPQTHATLDFVRGVMVFDKNRIYIVKPIGQRYWTQTAAMNDADEIAGAILMHTPSENA